jgi:epoxyqueuosine reductase
MDPAGLARAIVEECRALGFHRVGIAPVVPAARHAAYVEWLAAGRAGELAYLAEPAAVEARRDARALLPGARTVVAVALSYASPDRPPPAGGPRGTIARYARGADYHMVMKEKLRRLAERVVAVAGAGAGARACVDTAAVLERDVAERAGLGFVGKNTMLIAPGLGSYVLLGELFLDVEVEPTVAEPERRRCGECRLCLEACPTGAFDGEHVLDARRCISYLTIEQAGAIPRELRPLVGTRVFGCDVCQEVCPFNAAAREGAPELAARPRLEAPELVPLLGLGAAQFRQLVKRSALRRIHRGQLLRNVCVALGNAGDRAAIAPLRRALSVEGPLVRAHAAWALGRLGDGEGLEARLAVEEDEGVREEIAAALVTTRRMGLDSRPP